MNIQEKENIVRKNVLQIFKENFHVDKTNQEILDIRPDKEFDRNHMRYYEAILDIFLIDPKHLGHIKGKVGDTIKNVAKLWNTNLHSSPRQLH